MGKLIPMRQAYGEALVELGAVNSDVIVLSADVSSSDFSSLFEARFPDRFFNVGIAEPCLVDVAAGLARAGKIPFANTFAFLFALRAAEQVRTSVCFSNANVKLAATYAGVSDSFDGPTHHAITDLAVMRALPNMTIVVPADAREVRQAVPAAAAWQGPVYLRLCRNEMPDLPGAEHPSASLRTGPFEIGRVVELRAGGDLTLIGIGIMVGRCLDAADVLAREGIQARVLQVHTLKPLHTLAIISAARETGAIVTAEEHSIIGGLGGAVLETLAEAHPVPVVRVGIRDRFAETGPYLALLERMGLGVTNIVAAARRALEAKRSFQITL
jgi:transketolase